MIPRGTACSSTSSPGLDTVNERPLEEIVAEAVGRARRERSLSEEEIVGRVLEDPDIKILLEGYRLPDRSEGLEEVMIRDIRRKVHEDLNQESE